MKNRNNFSINNYIYMFMIMLNMYQIHTQHNMILSMEKKNSDFFNKIDSILSLIGFVQKDIASKQSSIGDIKDKLTKIEAVSGIQQSPQILNIPPQSASNIITNVNPESYTTYYVVGGIVVIVLAVGCYYYLTPYLASFIPMPSLFGWKGGGDSDVGGSIRMNLANIDAQSSVLPATSTAEGAISSTPAIEDHFKPIVDTIKEIQVPVNLRPYVPCAPDIPYNSSQNLVPSSPEGGTMAELADLTASLLQNL